MKRLMDFNEAKYAKTLTTWKSIVLPRQWVEGPKKPGPTRGRALFWAHVACGGAVNKSEAPICVMSRSGPFTYFNERGLSRAARSPPASSTPRLCLYELSRVRDHNYILEGPVSVCLTRELARSYSQLNIQQKTVAPNKRTGDIFMGPTGNYFDSCPC
ncbi:hypothetical protein EVAR_54320_1 [Eumeta japonica]|uniref:Uncharacterized protein n=1 Tax=Eumeta variegata TaxID=151549 RepID=A0A4C1Y8D9_EUMVA|nr:hypothetical protein EVAR_54320_1 [Eumeta japonica]